MENSRIPGEHFFTTSDNTALFYRHWPALQPGAKKVIVLFHRGHEHSGRLQHLVDELAMPDTAFYAWDARGHGKTSGPRGYSPSLARSVQDVDEFVRFALANTAPANTVQVDFVDKAPEYVTALRLILIDIIQRTA